MDPFNWKCPYCGHAQTVVEERYYRADFQIFNDKSAFGPVAGYAETIVCANDSCKKMTLEIVLCRRHDYPGGRWSVGHTLFTWPLLPESTAKPQPDYIPKPIVENYKQACRIRDLSPNASATMARRCLQGMIRDFCGITKATLAQEIDALDEMVQQGHAPAGVAPDTIDAIDHVRSIGNIGAHMEKDINLILDVEPDEAQALIDLIELLFEEWYVARKVREQRLERLGVVIENKKAKKAQAALPAPPEKLPAPASSAAKKAPEN
ncbi:MAG: DUF4145 domain-containing protein [Rhodospirillales bacterium]|nr:DUF4145 domain-containing protein [Rhodospirillales bacterium]